MKDIGDTSGMSFLARGGCETQNDNDIMIFGVSVSNLYFAGNLNLG